MRPAGKGASICRPASPTPTVGRPVRTEVDVQSAQGFVAVLRNRPFLRMWTSQAISQTAQNIINLALLVTVNGISKSATAVSGIIVAFALPGVILSTIAGVV